MDISSVSSGFNPYASSSQVSQAQSSSQTQEAQQTRQAEQREPRSDEMAERKEQAARPVVNAQGQTTGSLINVIA